MQEQIGNHRIIREIGLGAMGRVWLAHDSVIKRNVAIKELTLPQGIDAEDRQEAIDRFRREAQAAGSLSHPNIVTIFGVEEYEGVPYIVMEYLEGITLSQLLKEGPQSPQKAAGIVSQLADALAYAHSQGVVHRDIKPDNLFLLFDGRLKITDFGIARVMGSSTMTQVGTVMGTPGYMSPEQVRGEQVDWRTDIFSCGVVLYELLTGVKAFNAESLTSVMYKVVHEPPPPLTSLRPDLDPWMVGVVERACAKDPASRYQQASQLVQDLRTHSLSAAVPAAPSTILVPGAAPEAAYAPPARDETVLRAPGQAPPPAPEQAAPSLRRLSAPVLAAIIAACVLLAAGAVVTLVLMLSSSKVTVPDLEGVSFEKARSQLEKLGLEADKSEMASDKYEDGEVFSQSPGPGQQVEKGSTVKLDVAVGQTAATPMVEDKSEAELSAPFWTVVVITLDKRTGHTKQEAEDIAAQVRSAGLHAGVLDTALFGSLRLDYWVVYSGIFKGSNAAQQAKAYVSTVTAAGFGNLFPYEREVAVEGPHEVGPVIP